MKLEGSLVFWERYFVLKKKGLSWFREQHGEASCCECAALPMCCSCFKLMPGVRARSHLHTVSFIARAATGLRHSHFRIWRRECELYRHSPQERTPLRPPTESHRLMHPAIIQNHPGLNPLQVFVYRTDGTPLLDAPAPTPQVLAAAFASERTPCSLHSSACECCCSHTANISCRLRLWSSGHPTRRKGLHGCKFCSCS